MGFDQRNLLTMAQNVYLKVSDLCPCKPDKNGVYSFPPCCAQKCPSPPLPPPPPPLRPMGGVDSKQKHLLTVSMGVTASMIAIGLLFAIFCTAIRVYYLRRNNSRRRNPPILFGTQDDFLDENQGSTIDHPIWYINTVGLPQSVIDSITVFNYRKDEGLIEGTECSVCLSEFQEDENLRLLPKCSHAFHISCIDTWLRSHKNCPLCRAPIICGTIAPQATQSEPSLNNLDSRNEDNVVENHSGEEASNMREGGTSEVRNVHDHGCVHAIDVYTAENSNNSVPLLKTRNSDSDSRVLSDLAGKRRVVEEEMQPMRRSVSLDSPSAMTIYTDVANVVVNNGKQHLASFDTRSISEPNNSKSKMVAKPTSVSSSISKLMKSSSIGSSLQKGPILMKRSFSFSGKRSSSKHGRRHSVLPL